MKNKITWGNFLCSSALLFIVSLFLSTGMGLLASSQVQDYVRVQGLVATPQLIDSEHMSLLLSEVSSCASSSNLNMPPFPVLDVKKLNMVTLTRVCLSIRYHWSIRHDASRYDVLSRIYKDLNIEVLTREQSIEKLEKMYKQAVWLG